MAKNEKLEISKQCMMGHDIKVNGSKMQKMVKESRFPLTEHATRDIGKMDNVMALVDL